MGVAYNELGGEGRGGRGAYHLIPFKLEEKKNIGSKQ